MPTFGTMRSKVIFVDLPLFTRHVRYLYIFIITVLFLIVAFISTKSPWQSIILAKNAKPALGHAKIQKVEKAAHTPTQSVEQISELPKREIIESRDPGITTERSITTSPDLVDEKSSVDNVDVKHPLSIRDNPYAIKNDRICTGVKNLVFILLVHSSTIHFERRTSMRETWANYSMFKTHTMRVVFLLGQPEDASVQKSIEHENSLHNDIVQGHFLDTYHNLTHKGVLEIRWVSEFCTVTKTVVKIDDDVFVNVFKLMDDVINKYSGEYRKLLCMVRENGTSVIQRHEGKWKIGDSEFKNLTHYPFTYCNGNLIIFTADLVQHIYNAAKSTPFFWIDDVYVYGMLLEKVENATYVGLPNLSLDEGWSIKCFESRNKTCDLLMGNSNSEGVTKKIWFFVLNQFRDLAKVYAKDDAFSTAVH